MINLDLNFDMSGLNKYKESLRITGPIQRYIDRFIIDGVMEYTPIDTGRLTVSSIARHNPGSGLIEWSTPYALNVWHGKTSSGKDIVFNRTRHKLAGPYWAERYLSDNSEILRQEVIKRVRKI